MISLYLNILDIIGTIAFALSGAMVAIHKKMDLLGVNILGITTAVGGGIIRDIIIGQNPPQTFLYPQYTIISCICATLLFLFYYFRKDALFHTSLYENLLFIFDTVGLATFTIDGVIIGKSMQMDSTIFLPVFLGVITGVGGGIIRDIFANKTPDIFIKNIYASAAIIGALTSAILWPFYGEKTAIIWGITIVILIRFLASHFHLNLPKIH